MTGFKTPTGKPLPETLVISGLGVDDDNFSNDFATWNVSKAWRDCLAGKHGTPWLFDVAPAYENNKGVEVEEDKVQRFMRLPQVLALPLILVIENGAAYLIEGHHRLRALYRLGVPEFTCYVIEEQFGRNYWVLFNGERRGLKS